MMVVLTALARRVGWLYALVLCGLFVRYLWDNALLVPGIEHWWLEYPLVIGAIDGTLDWTALLAPYAQHRLLVPHTLSVVGALLTDWDIRFEVGINVVLIAVCVVAVIGLYRRSRLPALYGFAGVLLIGLLLSPVQFFNFVLGFQKCIWLIMAPLYVCAYSVARWGPTRLAWGIGALGSLIAAWSFVAGNLLWVLTPVALWLAGERRWRRFALWFVLAGLSTILYLWGNSVGAGGNTLATSPPPVLLVLTFLGGIASSHLDPLQTLVAQNTDQAQIIGIIGVILMVLTLAIGFAARSLTLKRVAPWLMLIGFAIGSGVMLYLGRRNTLENVISSRYVTLAIPFWIGLFGLIVTVASATEAQARLRNLTIRLGVLAAPLLIGLSVHTAYRFYFFDMQRDLSSQCLLLPDVLPDCTSLLVRAPRTGDAQQDQVLAVIDGLRQRRLSLYATRYLPDLRAVPLVNALPPGGASWQVQRIDETIYPVLFMRAPVQVEQRVYVPDTFERVQLDTAIYMPPADTIPETGDPALADGAGFAIWITDEGGIETLGYAGIYVPGSDNAPIPVTIDLTPYRGQRVTIRYGTEPRAHPDFDWSMWVEPRLSGDG